MDPVLLGNLILFGTPAIALSTLAATVLGWVRYHGQSKPGWVIACAITSAIMFLITLLVLLFIWSLSHYGP
jgi:hypothetical protein